MTACASTREPDPILWASGIGSDLMKPIVAPMVGGMITSTILGTSFGHVGAERITISHRSQTAIFGLPFLPELQYNNND
jgi:Cu/Ag efflux pump CusA